MQVRSVEIISVDFRHDFASGNIGNGDHLHFHSQQLLQIVRVHERDPKLGDDQ
jgi:hypothetical protein